MTEVPKITLTPCRSTGPRRGVRIVCYRRTHDQDRGVDVVLPYEYVEDDAGRPSSRSLRYRDIRPYPADHEFAEAWVEHLRAQLG